MNTSKQRLSRRQTQILEYIRECIVGRGWPPSIREIGNAVDLSSSSTVHSHLRALETKGYIRRSPSKPRALELLDAPGTMPVRERVARLEALVREGVQAWQGYVPGTTAMTEWAERAATLVAPDLLPAGVE